MELLAFEPLSAEEEKSIVAAIRDGDTRARDRLIESNLRLVATIARDFQGRGLVFDDLIGEGNIGLIRAVETYDPRFGTRFSTYAGYWIRQSIRHALITTTPSIRLPAYMVVLLGKWHRAERQLLSEKGEAPRPDEVAEALGLNEEQRDRVLQAIRTLSWTEPTDSDNSNEGVLQGLSADVPAPGEPLETAELRNHVASLIDDLPARERTVLELRFGLGGHAAHTLGEIGIQIGLTREGVRKLEGRILDRIRASLAERGLVDRSDMTDEPAGEAAATPHRRASRSHSSRGKGRACARCSDREHSPAPC